MNSRLNQFRYSYDRDVCEIFMKVSIGSSGAPTVAHGLTKGVVSVVRNSAGNYTINLKDNFFRFLGATLTVMTPSGVPAAPVMFVVSEQVNSSTAPSVVIQCAGATNSSTTTLIATDPGNGDTLLIKLAVRSAST